MIVLWDLAARHRGIVLGTENRTEGLLGYFTIYGDAGSAVEPIAGLFKTQVWSLSRHLGVPRQVVEKPPTADLWVGQTDEDELGARYADADRVLLLDDRSGLAPDEVADADRPASGGRAAGARAVPGHRVQARDPVPTRRAGDGSR